MEKDMTFKELSNTWLKNIRENRKPSTYEKYSNIVNTYLMPIMDERNIVEMKSVSLEEIISHKWNTPLIYPAKSTVNCIRSVYIQLVSFAGLTINSDISNDFAINDASTGITHNGVIVFSSKQQKRLMKYLLTETDRYKLGIIICLYTGIRVGELCALKTSDISLSEKKIFINSTVQRLKNEDKQSDPKTRLVVTSPKTPSSFREVPVCRLLCSLLKREQLEEKYFLGGRVPADPRRIQYRFRKYQKEAKIEEKNFHVLRHTFATNCITGGMDVKTLSLILGHADVKTTLNKYVHPSMDVKLKQINKAVKSFPVTEI